MKKISIYNNLISANDAVGELKNAFGIMVSVQKHPYFDCPLIIWRDLPKIDKRGK